ncbi:MAG TPA: AbrB/MazE/SpoVT family DNA-binding domain-containing protein [Thermodesulfobacteriota bacterium]|nr:AbrB/MazE/SpoVT family DNA-binding domain-containing protein [Thermodesulfobacteriota bacterium]
MIVKVSSKGQVVIPNEIREKMEIKAGTFLEFRQIDDKRLEVTVIKDMIKELEGIYKGSNLLQELEKEHREEIEQDELYSRRLGSHGMARTRKRIP